jgi:hypothetical protein
MHIIDAGNPDEVTDMELAQRVGDALNRSYPDHPWMISVQGRGIIVRHLAIANAVAMEIGREGFGSLLPREKLGTHQEMTDTVMRFGGQLLEAFDLPRGAWDGRDPKVPANWKAKQSGGFT